MADFSYMGTKRRLAGRIATIAADAPSGPFLDLFAGLSAVGAALAPTRSVWCNDMQYFSNAYTRSMFMAAKALNIGDRIDRIHAAFESNLAALSNEFAPLLSREWKAIHCGSTAEFISTNNEIASAAPSFQKKLRSAGVYCLFSTIHAGGYFGLRQSVEVDALRYSFDECLNSGLIDQEEHNWLVLALCRAVHAASNSTGHFAQFLTPKPTNISRVLSKRKRSIWDQWYAATEELRPHGRASWRKKNKCFHRDANDLLVWLKSQSKVPAVIYADPPYTSDQYSRYYHVLENVVLYDYPEVSGRGQYRGDRFTSSFSIKTKVRDAFVTLVERARELNASLILSYPSNGLLDEPKETINALLKQNYGQVRDPLVIMHEHSTMGASKGKQKHNVEELIFVAHC